MSMSMLIKHVQLQAFPDELKCLNKQQIISPNSSLIPLSPFLHEGEIRVGGRLKHSNLNFNQRHPILLPNKHPFTDLIISSEHLRSFHGGALQVLSLVRLKFWPIAGMVAVKRIISACTICKRQNPTFLNPLMGNLPTGRVTPSKPFHETGIDYAGPILTRELTRSNRRSPPTKAYIAIFVCFATKAVHVEVVTSLTTEAFLNSLKRFIARRGICKILHSDNGTNFQGAFNELKEWYKLLASKSHNTSVAKFCSDHLIQWQFIPARSPHFGGLWEAAVKSVKKHLYKFALNHTFTFEELSTVTAQIEAILNSRPLIPLSCDPNDFHVLTPGHFLVGEPLIAIPEPEVTNIQINRLTRFQLIQNIHQTFWRQWSRDYLHLLQVKAKKFQGNKVTTIKPGTLVLLKDASPPLCWRRGRVLNTHPGDDGIVRVATIQTSTGIVRRAINQLAQLLDVEDRDQDRD